MLRIASLCRAALLLAAVSCATAPETGDTVFDRLVDLPDGDVEVDDGPGEPRRPIDRPALDGGRSDPRGPDEGDPTPPPGPGSTPVGPTRGLSPVVRDHLENLKHPDPGTAEKIYWRLAEIDRRYIPELISQIENQERSSVTRLRILVKDPSFQGWLASRIPGMGRMEEYEEIGDEVRIISQQYDDKIAANIAPNGRGIDTRLRKKDGFPIGVVLRAALLNRFRSSRYPEGIDHTRELRRWWWAYYENVFGR